MLSVPYKNHGDTEEHFPELFQYEIIRRGGRNILINETREGEKQVFKDLHFHGGPGATLEMRGFSKTSLLNNIKQVGFVNINVYDTSIPEFGIFVGGDVSSFVISMRKP